MFGSNVQAQRHRRDGQPSRPHGPWSGGGHRGSWCTCSICRSIPDINPIEMVFHSLKSALRKGCGANYRESVSTHCVAQQKATLKSDRGSSPPTPTLTAISSSLAPASVARRICARLSLCAGARSAAIIQDMLSTIRSGKFNSDAASSTRNQQISASAPPKDLTYVDAPGNL
jgi:hypothetical protein